MTGTKFSSAAALALLATTGHGAAAVDNRTTGNTPAASQEVPDAGDAATDLRAAQASIDQGDLGEVWIELGRAGTRLLPRAVPVSQSAQPVTEGAVGHIRAARHALTDRDVDAAARETDQAIAMVQSPGMKASAASGGSVRPAGVPGPGPPLGVGNTGSGASGGGSAHR